MIMLVLAYALLCAFYFGVCAFLYRRITGNPSFVLSPDEWTAECSRKMKRTTIRPKLRKNLMRLTLPGFLLNGAWMILIGGTIYGLAASWWPQIVRLPYLVKIDTSRFLVLNQAQMPQIQLNRGDMPVAHVDSMPDMREIPETLRPQAAGDLMGKANAVADQAGVGEGKKDLNAAALREALAKQMPNAASGVTP